MCKLANSYLGLVREYTREIITFGGFALFLFGYNQLLEVTQQQADNAARTTRLLDDIDARIKELERWHALERKEQQQTTP